ncbi:permease-like cell division protein FtsX [Aliagarivorans taiwanensis]|uniref:permease-like cell division protein FtsX n=1 Tax=Aliagarivorans taiwanensis TaxID=561966 RepID=UPI0004099A30|nr:permease-like cell division protein FtsX [Aliagarivorans taiwanensis]
MQTNRAKVAWPVRFAMYWVRHVQQCISSLGELWRTPGSSLLTMAVLGVCLSLPASFYLAMKNLSSLTAYWQSETQLTVYLSQNIDQLQLQAMQKQLELRDEVASLSHISKEQGLAEFEQSSGFDDVLALLPYNPLPDVLVLQLNEAYRNAEAAKRLQQELRGMDQIERVSLDVEWLSRLNSLSNMASQMASLLVLLLLAAVVLIVSNTLRLGILSRRSEIEVMKLVGATDGFIRRPFLYIGFWYGVIGGLLAWVLCNVLLLWSEFALQQLGILYQYQVQLLGLDINEFVGLMVMACGMSLLASWFSVQRHIKEIEPS